MAVEFAGEHDHPCPEQSYEPLADAGIRYFPTRLLGIGKHGVVCKAHAYKTEGTRNIVALKITRRIQRNQGNGEAWLLASISHPSIVSLYHAFSDFSYHYMAMEYCQNGSLDRLLQKRRVLSFPELRLMFVQLAGGLKHVHDRGIIHRDLKPENVLLARNGSVKIGDFGLACGETFGGGPAGSRAYMAPEVLNGSACTKSSDVWSLGVLLYLAATGHHSFVNSTKLNKNLNNRTRWEEEICDDADSVSVVSVTSHMLTVAADRWTLQAVVDHDFFRSGSYPLSRADAFGTTSSPTTSFDAVANNRTFRHLCRAAGLGTQVQDVEWMRVPLNPLISCTEDVVNPTLWDVQPCILVDA